MNHNEAITAIVREAMDAIRATAMDAIERLSPDGQATAPVTPMKQTDFVEVRQRALEQMAVSSPYTLTHGSQAATTALPQNAVGDVTSNVSFPESDPDPADLVEMTEDQPQEDENSDAEDVFENSTDTQPEAENTPTPTAPTTSALPIFDIAQNEIPDFGDDHFATLEVEAVRAMCRLLASAVMSRGLALSQVQAAIKTASDGTATAITPLTKDQAVALYRAFRLELLKVKA
jgi:hypothetical protein